MKDNNNILDYNTWTAGEYEKKLPSTTYIPVNHNTNLTNDYSIIGESSIKIKSLTNDVGNMIFLEKTINANVNCYFSCNVYVVKGNATLRIFERTTSIQSSINLSEGVCGEVNINHINSAEQSVRFMITTRSDNVLLFIDNIFISTS